MHCTLKLGNWVFSWVLVSFSLHHFVVVVVFTVFFVLTACGVWIPVLESSDSCLLLKNLFFCWDCSLLLTPSCLSPSKPCVFAFLKVYHWTMSKSPVRWDRSQPPATLCKLNCHWWFHETSSLAVSKLHILAFLFLLQCISIYLSSKIIFCQHSRERGGSVSLAVIIGQQMSPKY